MAVPLQNYQKHLLLSTQIELLVYYMLGRHVRLSGSNSKRGRIGAFSARTYNAEVQGRIRNHFVKNRRQRSCEEVVILIYTIHKHSKEGTTLEISVHTFVRYTCFMTIDHRTGEIKINRGVIVMFR